MDRRAFIGSLTGGLLAAPLVAEAQSTGKAWRVGWLYEGSAPAASGTIATFREEFRKLGYVDTRDYLIHARFADGRIERLPELAAELTAPSCRCSHRYLDAEYAGGDASDTNNPHRDNWYC